MIKKLLLSFLIISSFIAFGSEPKAQKDKITYSKKHGKLLSISNKKQWRKFSYTKSGKFEAVKKSNGEQLRILYDSKGRLFKLVFKTRKKTNDVLAFRYERRQNKVTEIILKDRGSLSIDSKGKVSKIIGGELVPRRVSVLLSKYVNLARPLDPLIQRKLSPAANLATYFSLLLKNI